MYIACRKVNLIEIKGVPHLVDQLADRMLVERPMVELLRVKQLPVLPVLVVYDNNQQLAVLDNNQRLAVIDNNQLLVGLLAVLLMLAVLALIPRKTPLTAGYVKIERLEKVSKTCRKASLIVDRHLLVRAPTQLLVLLMGDYAKIDRLG